jgi:hypothetical protein
MTKYSSPYRSAFYSRYANHKRSARHATTKLSNFFSHSILTSRRVFPHYKEHPQSLPLAPFSRPQEYRFDNLHHLRLAIWSLRLFINNFYRSAKSRLFSRFLPRLFHNPICLSHDTTTITRPTSPPSLSILVLGQYGNKFFNLCCISRNIYQCSCRVFSIRLHLWSFSGSLRIVTCGVYRGGC